MIRLDAVNNINLVENLYGTGDPTLHIKQTLNTFRMNICSVNHGNADTIDLRMLSTM